MSEIPALTVLARAAGWIAVAKPSGIPARPGPGHPVSVLSLVEAWCREHDCGPHPPGVVHRLDLGTSGALIFSLRPESHRALVRAFRAATIRKEYTAIVEGCPKPRRGLIDLPLRRNASGLSVPDRNGREARTFYETVRRYQDATLLRVRPVTGRMHQIRAHLRARGTPVLGDPLYRVSTTDDFSPPPPRLCLHAQRLQLPEEIAGETAGGARTIEAPMPPDLLEYLQALEDGNGQRESRSPTV